LKDKKIMITAGPTYEAIDPVRFIGNHSTGLMGYELAKAAADLGGEVILILGPSNLSPKHELINVQNVISAEEMYDKAHEHFGNSDITICAAAVADYRPKNVATQKIKKKQERFSLDLVKNKDILLALGKLKKKQYLVGFALETENELENAKAKLKKKNLDAIILNSMNDKGAGFGGNTNKITFLDKNSQIKAFELKTKAEVAKDILNEILIRLNA
jgi:phosphopantothenoylcysteine decarboxylase/phosphopantothenate--cysteine ligase